VGLGNYTHPGTRHNVGYDLLEEFVRDKGLNWCAQRECLGYVSEQNSKEVIYLRPTTLMNLSGKVRHLQEFSDPQSVAATCRKFKVLPSSVVAIHDDLGRDFGKLSWKKGGSAAYCMPLIGLLTQEEDITECDP
jgi:peptidyl-tRNA hydrolase, PTH1 family